MLPSMMSRVTLVRKRLARVLDHGTMVVDSSTTESTATFAGSPQPTAGQIDFQNRFGAQAVYVVWVPDPHVDVQRDDLVTLYGTDYHVAREPERWITGTLDHAVIALERWNG